MKPDKRPGRIKKTRWFTCLIIWWVVAVFFYLYIAAQENSMVGHVTTTGIKTALTTAEQAGLPLLERDVQALTRLVQDITRLKGVVNISIIDHKNKIIAFTNPDQLLPRSSMAVQLESGVSHWPHTLDDGTRVICFSSDIIFAGTKIGEIFLAMGAEGAAGLTTVFFSTAVVSFIAIVLVLLIVDFQGLHPLIAAAREQGRTWIGSGDALPDGRDMICPVCGNNKPLTRSFLLAANLDRFPVVRPSKNNNGTAQLLHTHGVNLRELSRREDLGWLRRQMIHRCADIIKKLAGD